MATGSAAWNLSGNTSDESSGVNGSLNASALGVAAAPDGNALYYCANCDPGWHGPACDQSLDQLSYQRGLTRVLAQLLARQVLPRLDLAQEGHVRMLV